MHTLSLPHTGKKTTQLGFGCAYLQPETSYLLEAAYDAGIRHFDVARAYGRGLTEGAVGRFLRKHNDEITFTTKYGILPPFSHPVAEVARAILKPLVTRLRKAKAFDKGFDTAVASMYNLGKFDAEEATNSLLLSLKRLGKKRVDLFLMHEATASVLGHPSLLPALQSMQNEGLIGSFGVGGDSQNLKNLIQDRPEFCSVLQYDWTAVEDIIPHSEAFHIIYRTFAGKAANARDALKSNVKLLQTWSKTIDFDLSEKGSFERLMLKAAIVKRPDALVLFSSTRPKNIVANIEAASDMSLITPSLKLAECVREYALSSQS
jgi:D-threo-aldose 1-dehydrogenase